jgi:hypothetical protein
MHQASSVFMKAEVGGHKNRNRSAPNNKKKRSDEPNIAHTEQGKSFGMSYGTPHRDETTTKRRTSICGIHVDTIHRYSKALEVRRSERRMNLTAILEDGRNRAGHIESLAAGIDSNHEKT